MRILVSYRRNADQGFSNHEFCFYRHAYFPPGTYLVIFRVTPSARRTYFLFLVIGIRLIRPDPWGDNLRYIRLDSSVWIVPPLPMCDEDEAPAFVVPCRLATDVPSRSCLL